MEVDSRHPRGSFQHPKRWDWGLRRLKATATLGTNKVKNWLRTVLVGLVADILVPWQIFFCREPPQLATITAATITATIVIGWERRLAGSVPESTQFRLPGTWRLIQDTACDHSRTL